MSKILHRSSGFSLMEIAIAISVLTIGFLAVFGMNVASVNQVSQTRQRSIAKLAVITAREAMETQQFRRLQDTDNAWFMRGQGGTAPYPISWNKDGTAFIMPACSVGTNATLTPSLTTSPATITGGGGTGTIANPYAATVDGVTGCLCVEFPVPPLVAPKTRQHAGRIVFYLSERGQPATIPTATFPFSPTPGLTYLDCDGCHQAKATSATDLRLGHCATGLGSAPTPSSPAVAPPVAAATPPCPTKLIPVKISVDWVPTTNVSGSTPTTTTESYTTWFLLSYRGYD